MLRLHSTARSERPIAMPLARPIAARCGLTLIEMLVAMSITLLMMASVVTIFDQFGRGVNDSRATLEMTSRLRDVRNRLQSDLAGLTCPAVPWQRPESGVGYLEIFEGSNTDYDPTILNKPSEVGTPLDPSESILPPNARGTFDPEDGPFGLGDADDILMMTVRSPDRPFVGRMRVPVLPSGFQTVSIQSHVAEVIWYAVENPVDGSLGEPGMRTLYRRILLVMPGAEYRPPGSPTSVPLLQAATGYDEFNFYSHYDVSARRDATGRWIPNTLADLTKRENRFAHGTFPQDPREFPFWLRADALRSHRPIYNRRANGASALRPFGEPFAQGHPEWALRAGEDVIMTDILGFDIRVYDPQAPMYEVPLDGSTTTVAPGDPGWPPEGGNLNNPAGLGAYVDLGYAFRREHSPVYGLFPAFSGLTGTVVTPFSARPGPLHRGVQGTPGTYTLGAWFYDTWSFHYEHDGISQDGPDGIDEGTDGFNSDLVNSAVDDMSEFETSPPYPVPLQGVEIKIRAYERFSRQIREVTVRQDFATQ
ncbi:MAG: prepilin-type N-terminal cleavage/methylation domain-containing protein [Pirellulales bacterium]